MHFEESFKKKNFDSIIKFKQMKIISILFLVVFISSCSSEKQKLMEEIKTGETKLFGDSVRSLNIDESNNVLKNYIAFADKYQDDTTSAVYLFKAGDLSNGLQRPKEAIAIYERLRTGYPDYRKTPAALFMQAFIYETSLQDKEMAKEKYKEFISKYPSHNLTASAQASLDQLNANLSDEELIRMFEAQNK